MSQVEKTFGIKTTARLPYVTVKSFPQLGLLTALRFIEWVAENPQGVVSLPTGKTPEHFIKWTSYILQNWQSKRVQQLRETYSLLGDSLGGIGGITGGNGADVGANKKPNLSELRFVQIDEFYPIYSQQENSFFHYVNKFYIEGFGLSKAKALLINADNIPLYNGLHFSEVFPTVAIDLSLRYRECKSKQEEIQQQSIFLIDKWCSDYEARIRDIGGIGFFLGGIGPDGHIAFNVRGSDHFSTTRLTSTNFETQAVAASDLGGIEVSRNHLVITIGLDTIRYNPQAVAIIIAAGSAKAPVIKNALESPASNLYPATVLQNLPNARFYLTNSAASLLTNEVEQFYRTAPHHDDILLGMLPHIGRHLRNPSNKFHFAIMTSGFTAVTNSFLQERLLHTKQLLQEGQIQMVEYPSFFKDGYRYKWDKDVAHYLDKVAQRDELGMKRGLSHRIVRSLVDIYRVGDVSALHTLIENILHTLQQSYDGEKNSKQIQTLKGMLREFEEELVWGHFGVQTADVHHLRLGFYSGDIFTELPNRTRDVLPILEQLREIQPTVISVALDPEGSGPDTHYKVLQAVAEAVRLWQQERDVSRLRIWGYRNVWYKFHAAEANVIVPVSLNSLSLVESAFSDCYISQVNASFPSYNLDGKFSELARKIWVDQYKDIQLLMGKDFFYRHKDSRVRASHGLVFFREMSASEFLDYAGNLEQAMEGVAG